MKTGLGQRALHTLWAASLVGALLVASLVGLWLQQHNQQEQQTALSDLASRVIANTEDRLFVYSLGLHGTRGALATIGPRHITRPGFRAYIDSRDLPKEFPGALGFGYIQRVPQDLEKAFLEQARADGRPDLSIRQLAPHHGDRLVIRYIEPVAVNGSAIGLDIGSEPRRRVAALAAERSNAPTLTAPITLVQKSGVPAGGMLLLLPVYAQPVAPASPEERVGAAVGWVYAPIVLQEVMSTLQTYGGTFTVAIDDVEAGQPPVRAYASPGFGAPGALGLSRAVVHTTFGRQWRFEVRPTQRFVDGLRQYSPLRTALAVLGVELLILGLFFAQGRLLEHTRKAHADRASLAAIVDNSVDAIIGKRIDGTVTSWNQAAELMFGYRQDEAIGQPLATLIIPPELLHEEDNILRRLAAGESLEHFETVRRRKSGERIDVSVAVAPICDAEGRIVGASKTVRDITRQKNAEREIHRLNASLESEVEQRTQELNQALAMAHQASRSKAEFLANMSHEIRSPMNAVLGLAHLAERQTKDDETRTLIRKINQAGRILLGVIEDVLDFSKIEEGRLELEALDFQLAEVLDHVATIMGAYLGEKPVELVIAPPPASLGGLRGDPLRLEQVLINLVSNAIKFTASGHVLVSTRVEALDGDDVTLRFAVQDTGVGIDVAQQQAIFEPFAQADSSTTRRYGGSGLGLSICRRLVALMQGELGLVSAPGHGSEFWFTAVFRRALDAQPATSALTDLSVLVVDDNDVALEALKRTSEQLQWRATALSEGQAAIEAAVAGAPEGAPDVVVVDWQMPGVDGLQVARAIRQRAAGHRTPIVIMVTAYGMDRLERVCDSGVVDAVLSKPVTASSLHDAVAAAFHQQGRLETGGKTLPSEQRRLEGLRLLVVDDSLINRELAQGIFELEGATVGLASDGEEAVALLAREPEAFDLVLMDVQMPVMDGLEATRRIRRLSGCATMPIVALTAGARATEREAALSAGMQDVLTKPFNVDRTVQRLVALAANGRGTASAPPIQAVAVAPEPARSGFDFEAGQAMWHDPGVYRRCLTRFAEDNRSFISQWRHWTPAEAARACHKLRGAAASLGLTDLSSAAASVETRLQDDQACQVEWQALNEALAEALGAIDALAPIGTNLARPPDPLDRSQWLALLARLEAELDRDNPDGLWPLLDALAPQGGSAVAEIRACAERFDFRQAEAVLRRLRADFIPEPKDT